MEFDSVSKIYEDGTQAVYELDLEIEDGELMVVVGPSGCGKTTTLRMVAGLEEISDGEISVDGEVVNDVPPKDRDIAMVFQNYALYPHMTVYENMSFGLRLKRYPKDEIARRVQEAARILDITELLERKPRQLSGGQRQRVAMGRAIVRNPKVFLFDEPLSNLDAKLRVQMRTEIKRVHQKVRTTTVYVTHDQVEAMTLADRVVVMNRGKIEQIGAPNDLYHFPLTRFVAGFIGSPAMNFLAGRIDGGGEFEGPGGTRLPLAGVPAGLSGRAAIYGVRPEHFAIADDGVEATIQVVEPTGAEIQVAAKLGPEDVIAVFRERHRLNPGDRIRLKPNPQLVHLFDEVTGKRLNS
ncbi:MAG: ABC transporter ATP-binding protein [Xanthobacteraceae bacterium]